jgi:hypothetical protein
MSGRFAWRLEWIIRRAEGDATTEFAAQSREKQLADSTTTGGGTTVVTGGRLLRYAKRRDIIGRLAKRQVRKRTFPLLVMRRCGELARLSKSKPWRLI